MAGAGGVDGEVDGAEAGGEARLKEELLRARFEHEAADGIVAGRHAEAVRKAEAQQPALDDAVAANVEARGRRRASAPRRST